MNKYAMINRETNIVENKIVWDGISKYECHHGCYLVQLEESDFVDIGYLYDPVLKTYTNLKPEEIQNGYKKINRDFR